MDLLASIDIKKSLGSKSLKTKKSGKNLLRKRIPDFLTATTKTTPDWSYGIGDFSDLARQASLGLTDPQDSTDLTVLTTEFNEALGSLVPTNVSETLFGVDEREPSDFEKSKFIRQYRVVEDPYHVLDLLESGTLSGLEVETLAAFYPILYQEIVSSTLDAIAASTGADIPRSKTQALATLLQVPRLTPAILEVKPDEDGVEGDISGLAEAEETDTQRLVSK
tara:strand:+ start:4194 stop:4859 length:666 start_codon:yes stop_codon:yes gene_type:complete